MNRVLFGCFTLVLASAVANAQQPLQNPSPTVVPGLTPEAALGNPSNVHHLSNGSTVIFVNAPQASSCPVGMQARQGSAMQMLRAEDGTSQPMMTPTLTLTPTDSRQVVAATVTARGRAPGKRAMDLVARLVDQDHPAEKSGEITKTVMLKLHNDGNNSASGQLMLAGFSAVESLELDSITYSDGSTWKLAPESGCYVAPDPLLLIGER